MNLKYDEKGLIPAVVQDSRTGTVLMVAYMNEESYQKTLETGKACFFSRSRQQLWTKGETSGNYLLVKDIYVDCDEDTLLIKAEPAGPACHTGNTSCFYRKEENGALTEDKAQKGTKAAIWQQVYDVVKDRAENPKEGSYTNYLLEKGIDKILKKVGEESAETIIAAKNHSKEEIQYETADLLYHLAVMLYERGLTLDDVYEELEKRYK